VTVRAATTKAVAIVAATAVTFGCSLDSSEGPERIEGHDASEGTDGRAEPVGPTRQVRGVPQGWRHDAYGARAAAISAVRLSGAVAKAGFITRGDMIDQLATRDFAPDLALTTERQLADLAEALGTVEILPPGFSWTEVPLTARVLAATNSVARVEVWSVLVVATDDVAVPRQAWRTVTVKLAWEREDWKVDGWSTSPGPTPALAAGSTVSEGSDVVEVAEWPPATEASATGEGES
jgi:hypothetical protein